MYYPLVVIDNFFQDPDKIVEMANSHRFYPASDFGGAWPGSRTKSLYEIEESFYDYLTHRITNIYYDTGGREDSTFFQYDARFQKIKPFSESQYDKKNRGWIHKDTLSVFGGLIYLTKNPEPDTGTTMYRMKDGYNFCGMEEEMEKRKLYSALKSSEDYDFHFDKYHDQFEESVKINSVYNRLIIFDAQIHHGVQTFGAKERLTLPFFCHSISSNAIPMGLRASQ
jgi:hypothetical protein